MSTFQDNIIWLVSVSKERKKLRNLTSYHEHTKNDFPSCAGKEKKGPTRGTSKHRGSVCAPHPAALGSTLSITEELFLSMLPKFINGAALLRRIGGQCRSLISSYNDKFLQKRSPRWEFPILKQKICVKNARKKSSPVIEPQFQKKVLNLDAFSLKSF